MIQTKNLIANIIEERLFNNLCCQPPYDVDNYLEQRKLPLNFEHYQFTGKFRNTEFNLAIVIPLRDQHKRIFGVWLRETTDKFFRIFLFKSKDANLNEYQKYWICDDFDENKPTIIFESIFDALSYRKLTNDDRNIASSLGIKPTNNLISICKGGIIYCYDNDEAGLNGMLSKRNKDGIILINSAHKVKDVNELLNTECKWEFVEYFGLEATIQLRKMIDMGF